jgi:2-keto-3-deoxy-L-fuconate dehydrogenase
MGRLTGKTAFLTAAAAGIGRATALAYAREGAAVIATDIDAAGLESLKREAPAIEVAHLDVLHAGQCAEVGHRWPRIDVLLNVAGYVHHGTILECSPEDWARSFDINVGSMYRITRAVLPGMLERGAGSIINM